MTKQRESRETQQLQKKIKNSKKTYPVTENVSYETDSEHMNECLAFPLEKVGKAIFLFQETELLANC